MKPKYEFRGIIENGNVVYGGYFCDYYETEYIIDEDREFHQIVDGSRGMKMQILDKEFYHGDIITCDNLIPSMDYNEFVHKPKNDIRSNALAVSMIWGKNIFNLPLPTYAYRGEFEDISDNGINVSGMEVSDLDCNFRVIGSVHKLNGNDAFLYYPPHNFQFKDKVERECYNSGYWFDKKEKKHYFIESKGDRFEFSEVEDISMRLDCFNILTGCGSFYDGDTIEVEGAKIKIFWNKGRTEIKFLLL